MGGVEVQRTSTNEQNKNNSIVQYYLNCSAIVSYDQQNQRLQLRENTLFTI